MSDEILADDPQRAQQREHARRILGASEVPGVLREINNALLKGRGWFDEYDTGVIFKWGTWSTRRHIWIDVAGDTVRIRLREHLRCKPADTVAQCDGEYHAYSAAQAADLELMKRELKYYFDHPVAESSDDG